MIRLWLCFLTYALVWIATSCKKPSCSDGERNQNELNIDCGGDCEPCPSCFDGIRNQNETDIDCGGSCAACPPVWNSLSSGTGERLLSVAKGGSLVVAVGENGALVRSADGGKSWTTIVSGTTKHLRGVSIGGDKIVVIVGDEGTILRSSDAGLSFSALSVSRLRHFEDVMMLGPDTGIIVGRERTIYRTTNAGKDWKLTDSTNTLGGRDYFRISLTPTGNLYVIGDRYMVISTDRGLNWSSLSFNAFVDFTDFTGFYCLSDKRAFTVNHNALYYTFNFVEWLDKLVRVKQGQIDFNASTGVFAGRDDSDSRGIVKITNDDGVSWQDEQGLPVTTFFNDVVMLDEAEMVVVGDNGVILRRTRR